jgi:SAM-dependent methyltransferase
MSSPMREHDIRPKVLLDEFFAHLQRDAARLAARRSTFVAVQCVACGSDEGSAAFEKDGFPYRVCAVCGTLFASPRPTAADLEDFARNSEAVRFWSTHFYKQTAAARRERIFVPRARGIAALVREAGLERPAIADVGAGYGLFLDACRTEMPDADLLAIEPDARLAAVCREAGYRTVERWIEELEPGAVSADVVTAFEVIEHVFDPVAFIAGAARAMGREGRLLLTTLTISGFDLMTLWDRSRSITPPQHLNFISLDGFAHLARRAGLQLLRLTTPGTLDVDIVRNVLLESPAVEVPRVVRAVCLADERTRRDFQGFLVEHRMSSHVHVLLAPPA